MLGLPVFDFLRGSVSSLRLREIDKPGRVVVVLIVVFVGVGIIGVCSCFKTKVNSWSCLVVTSDPNKGICVVLSFSPGFVMREYLGSMLGFLPNVVSNSVFNSLIVSVLNWLASFNPVSSCVFSVCWVWVCCVWVASVLWVAPVACMDLVACVEVTMETPDNLLIGFTSIFSLFVFY